jgi:hypothetical protein
MASRFDACSSHFGDNFRSWPRVPLGIDHVTSFDPHAKHRLAVACRKCFDVFGGGSANRLFRELVIGRLRGRSAFAARAQENSGHRQETQ